jgi:hypothetical protein
MDFLCLETELLELRFIKDIDILKRKMFSRHCCRLTSLVVVADCCSPLRSQARG